MAMPIGRGSDWGSLWLTVTGRVPMTPVEQNTHIRGPGCGFTPTAPLLRSCEARTQPIPAALGAESPER